MPECICRASRLIASVASGFPPTARGNDVGCAMALTRRPSQRQRWIVGMAEVVGRGLGRHFVLMSDICYYLFCCMFISCSCCSTNLTGRFIRIPLEEGYMPNIPITSALSYIGVSLLLLGFFLVLTGLRIISIEKIAVAPGRKTWLLGVLLIIIGVGSVLLENTSHLGNTPVTTPVTGTFNITVPANVRWFDTGVSINSGQHFSIAATGQVNAWVGISKDYGPEGSGEAFIDACGGDSIAPGINCDALVGRLGNQRFRVGAFYESIATSSGNLYLAVNDSIFTDNTGAFDVTITLQ
jgi:hypothetical protein